MTSDRWLSLELRHLEALRAVAEAGAFGRAAAQLGYTQSAVSQQIAALERIAGKSLFTRPGGRQPVQLTAAGEVLLSHSAALLARARAAQADLATLDEDSGGQLRVGSYQSVGARILPEMLRRFAAQMPDVEVELRESSDDRELWRLLEEGELDVSFTMCPVEHELLEAVELLSDPYVLVAPAGSQVAERRTPPTAAHIAELPLIAFRSCRNMERAEALLRARGLQPNIVFRIDDHATVQGLVASGLGFALMPRLTVDANDARIVAIELGDHVPPRSVGIAWHRERRRTAATEAFVDVARQVCAAVPEA